jgi:glycosyltransferase involved in cell wall biosynthesis
LINTAIVHDYLTQLGGAERVAGRLAERFPDAALYTSTHRREAVPLEAIGGRAWRTSFLQPLASRVNLKTMLPFLPTAMAALPLDEHELVISSSSAFAHHAHAGEEALHVCYCHTPPRFLWESDAYFARRPTLRAALAPLLALQRQLDRRAASRVDAYFAVSEHIAARIRRVYGREAQVVHPPVDVASFRPSRERSGRFLVLSRLVASKRVELVVEAANRYGLPLDVIGSGPELAALRRAAGPTVRVLGWQSDAVVREALATCEAAVIAGVEDFGLVTAEVQASGRPPVAFAAGGALEIVEDGATGFLFDAQEPDAIADAMQRAAAHRLPVSDLVASARRFDLPAFHERFDAALAAARSQAPAKLEPIVAVEAGS